MIILKPILWICEYLLKAAAGIAAVIVVAAKGSFFSRIGSAFSSFDDLLVRFETWPEKITYMEKVVSDYQSLTAAQFNSKYGSQALDTVLGYLNESLQFIQRVYENFSIYPLRTVLSTLLVFILLYTAARLIRFVRQKGQGSLLVQKEREWGDKIFTNEEN